MVKAPRSTKKRVRRDGVDQNADFVARRPFAHTFFFQLTNTSDDLVGRFIALCKKYLSNHEGQTHFSIGTRVLEIRRPVSALNFDVAVNMVFDSIDAYETYRIDDRHQEFITQVAGMTAYRVVYDWHLNEYRDQV